MLTGPMESRPIGFELRAIWVQDYSGTHRKCWVSNDQVCWVLPRELPPLPPEKTLQRLMSCLPLHLPEEPTPWTST